MAKQKPEDIYNVIVAGHSGTGKTSLVDEIMFAAKANNRIGSVDDGTSLSDTAEDEMNTKASIDLSLLHCTYKEKLFHIFDTPGRSDFFGQFFCTLQAAENVLILIDAYSGIQINTRKAWKLAQQYGKTVTLVLSKLDVENIDLEKVIDDIQNTFGKKCVPFYLPDVTGGGIGKLHSVLAPAADAPELVKKFHEPLIESIVESDEELMMRYLDGEDVSKEIADHVANAIESETIIPILCYAHKQSTGITEILDVLINYCPSAASVKKLKVDQGKDEEGNAKIAEIEIGDKVMVGQVFKTIIDEHKGKMGLIRLFSGEVKSGDSFSNVTKEKALKFNKLFKFFGNKHEDLDSATAGEIFAAAKIDALDIGDTIANSEWKHTLLPVRFPSSMMSLAVRPKSRSDEQKIVDVLQRFAAEDPTFTSEMDPQTKEMIVSGMSQLHLNTNLQRIAKRHNVHVDTKLPRISYRETITKEVQDSYRHKKQTGGAGEFAEVYFRMRPYRDGEEDFNFVNALKGENVRRQFVPSVEKGCRSIMNDGILTGSPIIWVEVEFYDGKDHPVDGKDTAFQKAARECFKKCFLAANPTLLEPTVNLEVISPTTFAGEITQYLNTHRGRIAGIDIVQDEQIIKCVIPLSEIQELSSDLSSITQDQFSYSKGPAGYELMPMNVQQQVVKSMQQKED